MAAERQPLRVVVDSEGDITSESKLLGLQGKVVVAMATNKGIEHDLNNSDQIAYKSFAADDGRVDLRLLLSWLATQGCNEILVEAGATLAGAFVDQQLVDELWVYMAPKLMGSRARPLLNLPLDKMSQQVPMTLVESRVIGDDIRFIYQLESD